MAWEASGNEINSSKRLGVKCGDVIVYWNLGPMLSQNLLAELVALDKGDRLKACPFRSKIDSAYPAE